MFLLMPSKFLHSGKLTNRHGKSTILMVFTRKTWGFSWAFAVSFREGRSFVRHDMLQKFLFPL